MKSALFTKWTCDKCGKVEEQHFYPDYWEHYTFHRGSSFPFFGSLEIDLCNKCSYHENNPRLFIVKKLEELKINKWVFGLVGALALKGLIATIVQTYQIWSR